jgi:voltage-gated potassium channel
MTPTTIAGKWIVALWVIPAGLSNFALVIGRIAVLFDGKWKKEQEV